MNKHMHEQAGTRLVHTVMKRKLSFYTESHVEKRSGNRTWLERNSNIYLDLLLHLSGGRLSDTLFLISMCLVLISWMLWTLLLASTPHPLVNPAIYHLSGPVLLPISQILHQKTSRNEVSNGRPSSGEYKTGMQQEMVESKGTVICNYIFFLQWIRFSLYLFISRKGKILTCQGVRPRSFD